MEQWSTWLQGKKRICAYNRSPSKQFCIQFYMHGLRYEVVEYYKILPNWRQCQCVSQQWGLHTVTLLCDGIMLGTFQWLGKFLRGLGWFYLNFYFSIKYKSIDKIWLEFIRSPKIWSSFTWKHYSVDLTVITDILVFKIPTAEDFIYV